MEINNIKLIIQKSEACNCCKKKLIDYIDNIVKTNEFLIKRENKLQEIEQMFKSGVIDIEKLYNFVLDNINSEEV